MTKLSDLVGNSKSQYLGPFKPETPRFKPTVGENIIRMLPDYRDDRFDPAADVVICFKAAYEEVNHNVYVPLSELTAASKRPLAQAWLSLVTKTGGYGNLFRNEGLRQLFYKTYVFWVMARPVIKNGMEVQLASEKNVPLVATLGYTLVSALKAASDEHEAAGINVGHPKTGRDFRFNMEKLGAARTAVRNSFLGFSVRATEIPFPEKMETYIKSHPLDSFYYKPDLALEKELAGAFLSECSEILGGNVQESSPSGYKVSPQQKEEPKDSVTPEDTDDIPW